MGMRLGFIRGGEGVVGGGGGSRGVDAEGSLGGDEMGNVKFPNVFVLR